MAACLSEEDIIRVISDFFNLTLRKEDLANPSQEITTQLYILFLEDLGVSGFQQPDLTATQDIENIERYVDFMALSNVRLCIHELLQKTGFPGGFTFLDLIRPKKKRVLRILSHLVCLNARTEEVRVQWGKMEEKLQAKQKKRDQLNEKLEKLRKEIEQKAPLASKCRSSKPELEKKLEAVSRNFNHFKESGKLLQEEYRLEKKRLVTQKEKLSELQLELGQLREEITELESLIVRSPDKVSAETQAMEQQLATKISERSKLQLEYMEATNQVDCVSQAQKDLKPAMECLRETFTDLEEIREKCVAAEDLKTSIQSMSQKGRELKVVEEQCHENVRGIQNQLQKNRTQLKKQLQPLIQMNQDVKMDIQSKQEACQGSSEGQKQLLQQEMALIRRKEGLKCDRESHDKQFAVCCNKIDKVIQKVVKAIE